MKRTLLVRAVMPLLALLYVTVISPALYAQEAPTWVEGEHYELENDGKILKKWKASDANLVLDMNADPKLAEVEEIAKNAFVLKSIKTLHVGDKVRKINVQAFLMSSVGTVTLGKETADIDGAFYNISDIGDILVPIGNTALIRDGRAIYTADHKKLVWFLSSGHDKKLVIHADTKEIAYGACTLNSLLETIIFPAGLEKIGERAFSGAVALRKLIFGDKLVAVGDAAFRHCNKLYQIDIAAVEVPETGTNLFEAMNAETLASLQLRVPEASIPKYQAHAEWSKVGSISALVAIPSYAYELSEDAKTLKAWREPMQNIDMANDPVLKDVEIIGAGAFMEVGGLVENVVLPTNLKRIEDRAFFTCASIEHMPLPETVEYIGFQAMALMLSYHEGETLTLPAALKEIGGEAFYGLPVSRIALPEATEKIGKHAFAVMKKLLSISVAEGNQHFISRYGILLTKDLKTLLVCPPAKVTGEYDLAREGFNGLEEIAPAAFLGQAYLRSIHFPETLKTIGDQAFSEIEALQLVHLPASLEKLGDQVFFKSPQLANIIVAEANRFFVVDDHVLYDKDMTIALQGCADYKYRNFSLPETVKEIASGAFSEMQWLYNMTLPEGLENIYAFAFMNCPELEAVDIPSTIKWIGKNAFAQSGKLQKVICRATEVPGVEEDAFNNIAKGDQLTSVLYVPDGDGIMVAYANEPAFKKFDKILPISKLSNEKVKAVVVPCIAVREGTIEVMDADVESTLSLFTLNGQLVARVRADANGHAVIAVAAGTYLLSADGAETTKVVVK